MRATMRATLGVLPLVCMTGCAALWGLEDLSGDADAGLDGTTGGQQGDGAFDASLEATFGGDAADGAARGDSSDSSELRDSSGADGTGGESGPEGAVDAPADVAVDTAIDGAAEAEAGGDASDSGCGALNSPSHCGACQNVCDTTTGTPSCSGGVCSYACHPGRADCNASNPGADTDGCECATPACCSGGTCETAHRTGLSPPLPTTYYDCNPVSATVGQTQAMGACEAFTGSASACHVSTVGCVCVLVCGYQVTSVCGSSGGQCYCWQYAGGYFQGRVQAGTGSGCTATCGSSSDPTFN